MKAFYVGDKVKFGTRGTVEYEVFSGGEDTTDVQSLKSGTNKYDVPNEKLVLVEGGAARHRAVAEAQAEQNKKFWAEADRISAEFDEAISEARDKKADETFSEVKPGDHRRTSYGRSILFALNALGKHVYGGTAKNKTRRARAKLAKKARRNARKAQHARFLEITNANQG